jgi:predicted PhzF superfamily epimerase YddE/YHI9
VQNDILAVLGDTDAVRSLAPDLGALARIDARGICVTAARIDPGPAHDGAAHDGDHDGEHPDGPRRDGARHDFVSRFFAPAVGVPEDPVTGSAHCMLAPFWAERLGRTEMLGHQASPRGGEVRVTVRGDRVVLRGGAVTVVEGRLLAEPS